MFTATNNTFNKYQRSTWQGNNVDLLNLNSSQVAPNQGAPIRQQRHSQQLANPKTLTESLQSNIYSTLKNKEKEFVSDLNYYKNLNRYNVPKQAHLDMTASINPNKKRLVRGDSLANEGLPQPKIHARKQSLQKDMFSTKIQNKEEDFLDKFIKRQVNRKAYYMDNKNMERIPGEKHPKFLQNNEFLPNKENDDASFNPAYFDNMKKHKLLPNSTVIDRQYKDYAMEKQLHQNYQRILNQQMMYNDVNKMDIAKYQKMANQLKEPVVFNERNTNDIEDGLKKTMMGLYQQ